MSGRYQVFSQVGSKLAKGPNFPQPGAHMRSCVVRAFFRQDGLGFAAVVLRAPLEYPVMNPADNSYVFHTHEAAVVAGCLLARRVCS